MSRYSRTGALLAGAMAIITPLSVLSAGSASAGKANVDIKLAAVPESSVVDAATGGNLTLTVKDAVGVYAVAAYGSSLRFTAPSNLKFTGVPTGKYNAAWIWSQWYSCKLDSETQITCSRASGWYGQPSRNETIWIPVKARSDAASGTHTGGQAEFNPGPYFTSKNKVTIPFQYSIKGVDPPPKPPEPPVKPVSQTVDLWWQNPMPATLLPGAKADIVTSLTEGITGVATTDALGTQMVYTLPPGVAKFTGVYNPDTKHYKCSVVSDTRAVCEVIAGEFRPMGRTDKYTLNIQALDNAAPGTYAGKMEFLPAGRPDGTLANNTMAFPITITKPEPPVKPTVPEQPVTKPPVPEPPVVGPTADGDCKRFWTREPNHQIEVSTTQTGQRVHTATWTDVVCGSVTVQVPRGQQTMVTAWANAETKCKGAKGYCEARILADGKELHPEYTGDPTRFVLETADPADRYRAASMIRAGLLSCPAGNPAPNCDKKIQVQILTSADEFWYDDGILRAEIWKTAPNTTDTKPTTETKPTRPTNETKPTGEVKPAFESRPAGSLLPAPGQRGYLAPATSDTLVVTPRANVQFSLAPNRAATSQQWEINGLGPDVNEVKNRASEKCLDTSTEWQFTAATCTQTRHTELEFRHLGDGTFEMYSPKLETCADHSNAVRYPGADVIQMKPCTKIPAQRWKWIPLSS